MKFEYYISREFLSERNIYSVAEGKIKYSSSVLFRTMPQQFLYLQTIDMSDYEDKFNLDELLADEDIVLFERELYPELFDKIIDVVNSQYEKEMADHLKK